MCLMYNYWDVGFVEFKRVDLILRKIMFVSKCKFIFLQMCLE